MNWSGKWRPDDAEFLWKFRVCPILKDFTQESNMVRFSF